MGGDDLRQGIHTLLKAKDQRAYELAVGEAVAKPVMHLWQGGNELLFQ